MKKTTLITLFMLLAAPVTSAAECKTDAALKERGWTIYSIDRFQEKSKDVKDWFKSHRGDFVFDTDGVIKTDRNVALQVTSYDKLSTPQDEMYGDIVFFRVVPTNELVEIRWYKGNKSHSVYKGVALECASDSIPWAENTLF